MTREFEKLPPLPEPIGFLLWDETDRPGTEMFVFGAEDPAHKQGAADHQGHRWISEPVFTADKMRAAQRAGDWKEFEPAFRCGSGEATGRYRVVGDRVEIEVSGTICTEGNKAVIDPPLVVMPVDPTPEMIETLCQEMANYEDSARKCWAALLELARGQT